MTRRPVENAMTETANDSLIIAGRSYSARLLTGTRKFKDREETRKATDAAGAEIVTVAIRRTNIGQDPGQTNLLDMFPASREGRIARRRRSSASSPIDRTMGEAR